MEKEKCLLEIKKLRKYYPKSSQMFFHQNEYVKAVNGIDLNIYEGETLGIVGESGCGKSTLGRQMVGLEESTEGEILFHGTSIANRKSLKKNRTKIQMVFQNTSASLNPRKSIYETLYAPLHYHHVVSKDKIEAEIDRLLQMVGLSPDMKHRYPHEFSGGQRQRIGIARALSVKPEFLVLDEPVSALDPSVQASILNLLKILQKELQLTCVFIGHGLSAVRYSSDRIAVMYLGQILELAPTEELFQNPLHPYTQALFDAAPVMDIAKREQKRVILTGEAALKTQKDSDTGCLFFDRCPYAVKSCQYTKMQLEDISNENTNAYQKHFCACPVKIEEHQQSHAKVHKKEETNV